MRVNTTTVEVLIKKTIWKFPLPSDPRFTIDMPKGAKILTTQVDSKLDEPVIWAEVNKEAETETRRFQIILTGEPIDNDVIENRNYIGTFQGGDHTFHLYELIY